MRRYCPNCNEVVPDPKPGKDWGCLNCSIFWAYTVGLRMLGTRPLTEVELAARDEAGHRAFYGLDL